MTDGGIVGSEEVGVRGRADTVDVLTRAYVVDHLETEVYSAPSHSFLFTSMEPTLEIRPRDRAFDGLAEWPWAWSRYLEENMVVEDKSRGRKPQAN